MVVQAVVVMRKEEDGKQWGGKGVEGKGDDCDEKQQQQLLLQKVQ